MNKSRSPICAVALALALAGCRNPFAGSARVDHQAQLSNQSVNQNLADVTNASIGSIKDGNVTEAVAFRLMNDDGTILEEIPSAALLDQPAFRESQRLLAIEDSADAVFETHNWRTLTLIKPNALRKESAVVPTDVGELLSPSEIVGRNSAVVIVPEYSPLIMEEGAVLIDTEFAFEAEEALKKAGFGKVFFLVHTRWTLTMEAFRDRPRTREELERRKKKYREVLNQMQLRGFQPHVSE
jgi:hypothetical protein